MDTAFVTTFCKCVKKKHFICSNYNLADIQQLMCVYSCLSSLKKKYITRLHLQPQTKDMLLIWNLFGLYDLKNRQNRKLTLFT